jgi:hypothetical protein
MKYLVPPFEFQSVFARLRKSTISFVISVCPSVRKEELWSHRIYFYEILYLIIIRKSVEYIKVSLKYDRNIGYFTWRATCIYDTIFLNSSENEKRFRKKAIEKIKTRILCSITCFRKSCRLWDYMGKYGGAGQATDGNIIRNMKDDLHAG